MVQDSATGAAAARWGLHCARLLAAALGATQPVGNSNECHLDGKRVVIKCAAEGRRNVGVTFKMLDRLDEVIAAFAFDDGSFDLWSLTPVQYRQGMRDTASHGASAGKVGIVEKVFFERNGRHIGRLKTS